MKEDKKCGVIQRKRTLAEAAKAIRKYVNRDYTDKEINDLVRHARDERWKQTYSLSTKRNAPTGCAKPGTPIRRTL
jgi:hypothetical protein